ncbi:MAG: hypothetical protein JWL68_5056, partial [Actinomycetia bacterium]|nr:hypothetical protein [Actinomycetes bacterium]
MQNGAMPAVRSILRAAVQAPVSGWARREVLFCLAGVPFGLANPVVGFYLVTVLLWLATPGRRPPNPAWWDLLGGLLAAGLILIVLAAGAARPLGAASR